MLEESAFQHPELLMLQWRALTRVILGLDFSLRMTEMAY